VAPWPNSGSVRPRVGDRDAAGRLAALVVGADDPRVELSTLTGGGGIVLTAILGVDGLTIVLVWAFAAVVGIISLGLRRGQ
jgi:hypothetical protein